MQMQWRGQYRIAFHTDNDPITLDDFQEDQLSLESRRARIKIEGYAFKPWIKYYVEYGLSSSSPLDFRLMLEKTSYLSQRKKMHMKLFAPAT
jgi:hypothetical protein